MSNEHGETVNAEAGKSSDVFILLETERGFECIGCKVLEQEGYPSSVFVAPTAMRMLVHAGEHLGLGHQTAPGSVDRLREESLGDPELRRTLAKLREEWDRGSRDDLLVEVEQAIVVARVAERNRENANERLRRRVENLTAELLLWESGAMANATGHMNRCARLERGWSCAKGCAVAERDVLRELVRENAAGERVH